MLPEDAWRLEILRRRVIDLFRGWGYQLVIPPHLEYLDSLLTGVGKDLELQTFKLIDELTGRLMGVRADMTPQVARIESQFLRGDDPVRLCYVGTVLITRPDGPGGSREPMQLGAELFGSESSEADCEVIRLMLETLRLAGIESPHLDLGHVGVYRALAREAGLSPEQEGALFDALHRKSRPDLGQLLGDIGLPAAQTERLFVLSELNGPVSELGDAVARFSDAGPRSSRRSTGCGWSRAPSPTSCRICPCTSTWASYAGTTTTPGSCSPHSCLSWGRRSPGAGATITSTIAVRPPGSVPICARSVAWIAPRRIRPPARSRRRPATTPGASTPSRRYAPGKSCSGADAGAGGSDS